MDTITKSYLEKFIEQYELENTTEEVSNNFEKFCSYTILSKELANSSLSLDDIERVGVGKNKGIDSICVIINGKLVHTIEEAEDLLEMNGFIHVNFIFIQSKTSEKFDDSEMGNLGDTIKDFFKEIPSYSLTNEAKDYHEILIRLYENFADILSFNSKAYYCSTGKWNSSTSIQTTLNNKIDEIKKEHEKFKNGDFNIIPFGRNDLQKYFDKITSPLSIEFLFSNKVEITNIPDTIDEAYIGNIELVEFKKIIIDPDTKQIRNLFYDNVRDDLGVKNPVNKGISETLENKNYSLFPLLNNGVTIIAEENKGSGSKFILDNCQVVNGCQTSNVIYRNIDNDDIDTLRIPIKLIITKNSEIKDNIITATNSQTVLKEEQTMALTNFQKDLEKYYNAKSDGIYYERRTNQYVNSEIKKKNIVDLREQIKTVVAIFMEEPHLVSGYFSKIYNSNKDKLFHEEHKFEPYYFAGLIQYKFKDLLNKKIIDRKYNKARYHVFMLFRKIFESQEFDAKLMRQKKIKEYIEELTVFLEGNKIENSFQKVFDLIDLTDIDLNVQKDIYKKSTTNKLLDKFKEKYK